MIAKNNRIRIFQSQNLNLDNLEQWPVFHETVHVTYMHAHTQYETIKKMRKKQVYGEMGKYCIPLQITHSNGGHMANIL